MKEVPGIITSSDMIIYDLYCCIMDFLFVELSF